MATCCDDHDICYDTCNKDKELCDLDFKRCLYSYCDKYEKSTVGGELMVKGNWNFLSSKYCNWKFIEALFIGCKTAAKMLYTGSVTLGCKPYLNAQSKACYCPSSGSSSGNNKNKQYKEQTYSSKRDNRQDDKRKAPNYGWKNPEEI